MQTFLVALGDMLQLYGYQILLMFGFILLLACLTYCLEKIVYKILGKRAYYRFSLLTAPIGTTVHELGHALFALLGNYKIVDMKLFIRNPTDGVLGYVSCVPRKNNLYTKASGFALGTGPIYLGLGLLMLLMFLFTRNIFNGVIGFMASFDENGLSFASLGQSIMGVLKVLFDLDNFKNIGFYLFLLICPSIALHLQLSPPDIKISIRGGVFLLILIFLTDFILLILKYQWLVSFAYIFIQFGAIMLNCMVLCVILSLFVSVFAIIVKVFLSMFKKRKKV